MDTANDLRIRLAEKGLKELEKLLQNVKVQKRKELVSKVKEMSALLQTLKYSYVDAKTLKEFDEFRKLVSEAKSIRDAIKKAERDFNTISADYWLEYLESLPELMDRGEIDSPCLAIKFFVGKITSRSEILKGKLWLCLIDCGFRLEVVTNSNEFVVGKKAIVAYLPPKKFGDVISRGMFVSLVDDDLKEGEADIETIEKYCKNAKAEILSLLQ